MNFLVVKFSLISWFDSLWFLGMVDLVFEIVMQVLVRYESLWFLGIAGLLFEIVV